MTDLQPVIDSFSFCMVVVGGKTALITEFLERGSRDHVYFLADQRGTDTNASRFAKQCATEFDDILPAVEGFADAFEYDRPYQTVSAVLPILHRHAQDHPRRDAP